MTVMRIFTDRKVSGVIVLINVNVTNEATYFLIISLYLCLHQLVKTKDSKKMKQLFASCVFAHQAATGQRGKARRSCLCESQRCQ